MIFLERIFSASNVSRCQVKPIEQAKGEEDFYMTTYTSSFFLIFCIILVLGSISILILWLGERQIFWMDPQLQSQCCPIRYFLQSLFLVVLLALTMKHHL